VVIGRVITIRPAVRPWHDITDPDVAKALAHPLRTHILASLEDRTANPK
jgi:hypothetical protein